MQTLFRNKEFKRKPLCKKVTPNTTRTSANINNPKIHEDVTDNGRFKCVTHHCLFLYKMHCTLFGEDNGKQGRQFRLRLEYSNVL